MFLASSAKPIDDILKNLVNEIETQSPSLSVLAARRLRYKLSQTLVEVTIKEPRPFNVLEEFIIRAGIEINPPPTGDELASVLGLDPIFVRSTIKTLQALQTLAVTPAITVTAEGRSFYEKGSVPQPPSSRQIYAVTDYLNGNITFQSEALNDVPVNLPDLAKFVTIEHKISDISSLPLAEIQQNIQASALGLHTPEEGKIVTSLKVVTPNQIFWKAISLFIVFDSIEDKLSIQIRSGKRILEAPSNWLQELYSEGKLSLQELCELSNKTINFEREAILNHKNAEIESRLEKIRQQALEAVQNNSPEIATAIQLRDKQIPQVFSEVLNSAKYQILIYSPWVNHAVVDNKFLTLLQTLVNRGIWILIGYGIARRQEDEDKPISPELLEKLQAIKTPDGLPGVQIFWLGDSHIKEVIVDQKIHLCGSHNWLSYRGDYLPRGESVYQVTIPQQVEEAYKFLSHRFQNHAQKLWQTAVENRDFQLAVDSLCVWGALGMEEIALKNIHQNNWLEVLPVWLDVISQRLRSKNLPDDLASLEMALSLLNQLTGEEAFIESLRHGWRKVIGAINRKTAVNLLSDEVRSQFLRLNISQET